MTIGTDNKPIFGDRYRPGKRRKSFAGYPPRSQWYPTNQTVRSVIKSGSTLQMVAIEIPVLTYGKAGSWRPDDVVKMNSRNGVGSAKIRRARSK